MSKAEEFERGMQAVRMVYGSIWDRELAFAAEWADSVQLEGDIGDAEDGSICFRKDDAEYWFLIGDGQWDADDPRGEMIDELLAERAKDGEALTIAKAALDAADEALRDSRAATIAANECYAAAEREIDRLRTSLGEVMGERDEARARCTTAQSELLPTIDALTSMNTQLGRELDAMTRARDALGEYTYASSAAEEVRIAALRAVGGK